MKDKTLQIRVDESFLCKLNYLQKINGLKSNSETIRKVVEKEYRKEEYPVYTENGNTEKCICPKCNRYLGYYIPNKSNGFRFCKYCGAKIYCELKESK